MNDASSTSIIDGDQSRVIGELLAPDIANMLHGHKERQARETLVGLLEPEIADILAALDEDDRVVAFRLLPREKAIEVFEYLSLDLQESLIQNLGNERVAELVNEMDPDDRVELFEDIDEEQVQRLLKLMRPEERRETRMMLEYPEESVGRLMTTDFLTITPQMTAQGVLDFVRQNARDAETLDTLYVVDDRGKLLDEMRLRHILLADPQRTIHAMMDDQVTALKADDDREEAVRAMERYDRPVLPVVDDIGKLIGVVTFDDVADVAEEETTEDMQKMAGMERLDAPYITASLMTLVRKRVVWLMVLFAGGLLTVTAMGAFEDKLEQLTVLALFVPLVIASGGNSGSQAASLIIRALAIGEVQVRDWAAVARRELVTGLAMGSVLGVLGLIVGTLVAGMVITDRATSYHALVGFAIGTSLVGVVLIGTLTGALLPILLEKIGLDPATSSAPFVATIADVGGLLVYFICATLILQL